MRFQQPKGFLSDDVTSRDFLVSGPFQALVVLPIALRIFRANQQTRPHRATANASINASLKTLIMPHVRRGRAHFHSFLPCFRAAGEQNTILEAPRGVSGSALLPVFGVPVYNVKTASFSWAYSFASSPACASNCFGSPASASLPPESTSTWSASSTWRRA